MPRLPLRYLLDLGGHTFRAREVKGMEAISKAFRFEIRFAEGDGGLLDPFGWNNHAQHE